MERNILLTIEYDGTDFYGWQRQPELRTVQGEVEKALTFVCGKPVQINGTSRTDAGVHALGQRASFCGEFGIPTDRIKIAVNNCLAGGMHSSSKAADIKIIEVEEVPVDFHARFDSKGKKYRYLIRNRKELDTFRRNFCYQVKEPLDVSLMKEASRLLVGKHDFSAFQSAGGTPRETTVRTIYSLDVSSDEDGDVIIEIVGDGFLYNMVRIITGTLVEVGLEKINPMALSAIIKSGDRQNAGHTAPPQGLYLVEVYYEPIE